MVINYESGVELKRVLHLLESLFAFQWYLQMLCRVHSLLQFRDCYCLASEALLPLLVSATKSIEECHCFQSAPAFLSSWLTKRTRSCFDLVVKFPIFFRAASKPSKRRVINEAQMKLAGAKKKKGVNEVSNDFKRESERKGGTPLPFPLVEEASDLPQQTQLFRWAQALQRVRSRLIRVELDLRKRPPSPDLEECFQKGLSVGILGIVHWLKRREPKLVSQFNRGWPFVLRTERKFVVQHTSS